MSKELKKCPFCGSELYHADQHHYWRCLTSGCVMNTNFLYEVHLESWNTRPIESELRGRIKDIDKRYVDTIEALNRTHCEIVELQGNTEIQKTIITSQEKEIEKLKQARKETQMYGCFIHDRGAEDLCCVVKENDKLTAEVGRLKEALTEITRSTCVEACRFDAKKALKGEQKQKTKNPVSGCRLTLYPKSGERK